MISDDALVRALSGLLVWTILRTRPAGQEFLDSHFWICCVGIFTQVARASLVCDLVFSFRSFSEVLGAKLAVNIFDGAFPNFSTVRYGDLINTASAICSLRLIRYFLACVGGVSHCSYLSLRVSRFPRGRTIRLFTTLG